MDLIGRLVGGEVLEVQVRILPVFQGAGAFKRGATKGRTLVFIQFDADVVSDDEMLAAVAKTGLIQGPPVGVGIVGGKEFKATSGG